MNIAHRYTLPDCYFACSVSFSSVQPGNSSTEPLPKKPWVKKWPQYTEGTGWRLVEDHRERKSSGGFGPEDEQKATEFFLPEDDWQSQPRTMKKVGPLPDGAALARPEKPLLTAQSEKRVEIDAAYEAALVAALTMPSASPTPMTVAVETSALLAVDPDAVDSIRAALNTRRADLRTQVEAADTLDAVAAIVVSYPV